MTTRVFAPPGPWTPGQIVPLNSSESHYLLRVRRASPGTPLEVLDGVDACWEAQLHERRGSTAVVRLCGPRSRLQSVPLDLLLVLPEPRATLDSLGNASELGATTAWLIRGDHSPGGVPSPERIDKTLRAAQRQCGRPIPLRVHGPLSLAQALHGSAMPSASSTERMATARPGYVASAPDRDRHPAMTPVEVDPTLGARLLIGPEGGLSDPERQVAIEAGLRPLSLGPWILRTPTAVTAGLGRLRGAAPPPSPPSRP